MASPEVGKKMPTCFSGLLAALTPSSKKHWKEKKDAERDAFLRRPRRASEARSMFFDPREQTGVRKSLSKGWKKEFPGTPHAASRKMHELEISPDPSSEDDEDDRKKLRHGDKTPGYESMGAAARSFMRTGSDDSLREVLDSTTNQHMHYKHVLLSPRGGGEDTDARPYAMGSLRESAFRARVRSPEEVAEGLEFLEQQVAQLPRLVGKRPSSLRLGASATTSKAFAFGGRATNLRFAPKAPKDEDESEGISNVSLSSSSSGALGRVPFADVVLTRKDYRRKLLHGDKTAGDTDESMGFVRTGSDDSLKEVLDSTRNQHRHYKARSQKNVLENKRTCSKTRNNASSPCIPFDRAFPPPRSTRTVHPLR
jgi:hypothetical protein